MDTVNGVVSREGIFGPGDVTARSTPGPLNTSIPVILSNVDTGNTRILPESANSPTQSRSGQSNVFSRLQALFPGSPSINSPSSPSNTQARSPLSAGQHTGAMTQLGPQALKVRIITWNMHDSLPKGKLEELLGSVPLYTPPLEGERESSVIPELPLDDSHPYHLVVVAGQECPTSSGIPMGLGAALNNIIEREKDKDKEVKRHKSTKSTSGDKENLQLKPQDRADHRTSADLKCRKPEDEYNSQELEEKEKSSSLDNPHAQNGPTSGWSAILEDWFCNGMGSGAAPLLSPSAPLLVVSNPSFSRHHHSHHLRTSSKESIGYPSRQKSPPPALGPYELLIKERLMGIYLAVFIYRDIKHLVRGKDKSAVTAGLIGGRVGNKGGVAISINLNGTTLLFINAHLAAHEDRAQHRIQNLAKIKAELEIDDFLTQDDPRSSAEDLTDKFDYTFIFGDLNFRLNITRLHADWLISRQDYDQALGFDQLREIMKTGSAFSGFSEAPIDFPPTFKYDVLRSSKSGRRSKGHDGRHRRHLEVDERADENHEYDHDADEDGDENAEVGIDVSEVASVASTTVTSVHSKKTATTTDNDDSDSDSDDYDYFGTSSIKSTRIKGKAFVQEVAMKAKNKWLALVSPSSPSFRRSVSPSEKAEQRPALKEMSHSAVELGNDSPALPSPHDPPVSAVSERRPKSLSIRRSESSAKGARSRKSEVDDEEDEKGVYDSSNKKRVPSWCDRILWKSTIRPLPEEEETGAQSPSRPRTRVASFLANALRPRTRLSTLFSSATSSNMSPLSNPEAGISSELGLGITQLNSSPSPYASPSHSHPNILPVPTRSPSSPQIQPRPRMRGPKLYMSRSIDIAPNDAANIVDLTQPLALEPSTTSNPSRVKSQRSRSFSVTETSGPAPWTPIIDSKQSKQPKQPSFKITTSPLSEDPIANSMQGPSSAPVPLLSTPGKGPITSSNTGVNSRIPISNPNSSSANSPSTKWWHPPFFSRDAGLMPNSSSPTLTANTNTSTLPASVPRPRRGQVVPLAYGTLDDHSMRRLEGRSDHRPVIGSYAIYI